MITKEVLKNLNGLNEYFKNHDIDFLVVGSIALEICGIDLGRMTHDIDVEAICDDAQEKLMRDLDSVYRGDSDDASDLHCLVFKFGETKVNVWPKKEFSHEKFVCKDGIKFAGVMSVLKEKMNRHREKDFRDIQNIIKEITSL